MIEFYEHSDMIITDEVVDWARHGNDLATAAAAKSLFQCASSQKYDESGAGTEYWITGGYGSLVISNKKQNQKFQAYLRSKIEELSRP